MSLFPHFLQMLILLTRLILPQTSPEVLAAREITVTESDSEYRVTLRASARNTSWEIEGRECAMLKILVDDRYDQHVFLVRGGLEADYEFQVGPLAAGHHELRIQWDRSWTPELADRPEVQIASIAPVNRSDPAQESVLRAPIIYTRKDTVGRFSDLPLVVYWESEKSGAQNHVTYTVILSNEDGGTNTERLMARWGRTADIEWFYDYSTGGGQTTETYQAANHKTLHFQGQHEGLHPILYDATRNNNFSDAMDAPPQVRLRLVPVYANLQGLSRESVMDLFPWTYSIMAQEMIREGKVENPADPNTPALSDQRNYVYLDACAKQRGTELYFEINTRNSNRWFRSDHADQKARIERSGCFRSSIELPPGTGPQELHLLRIQCSPAPPPEGEMPVSSPRANILTVKRLFFLGQDYMPGPNLLDRNVNRVLKPGQSLEIPISVRVKQ
jgi:hypothetical protein